MFCIAIVDSGNYAFKLVSRLEKKGYVFEVVSTPCQIAKNGCGYSIKFPFEYRDVILGEAIETGIAIREIFRVIPGVTKNIYEKIY